MFDATSQPRKVLVIHDTGTNGHVMRKRLEPLRKALEKYDQRFEFTCVDAPMMLPSMSNVTLPIEGSFARLRLPPSEHMNTVPDVAALRNCIQDISYIRAAKAELMSNALQPRRTGAEWGSFIDCAPVLARLAKQDPQLIKVAEKILDDKPSHARDSRWWLIPGDNEGGRWGGYEYSLSYLWTILKEQGPFEGAIGFSVGCTMVQLLQGMLSEAAVRTHTPLCQVAPQQPFQFLMHFAPYYACCPNYKPFIPASRRKETRTIIYYGVADTVVSPDFCRRFAHDVGAEAICEHPGGHTLPKESTWPDQGARWLYQSSMMQDDGLLSPPPQSYVTQPQRIKTGLANL